MKSDPYIPQLTINNVGAIPLKKMLRTLEPYTQTHVPEGIQGDPEAYQEIERLIGRFANVYGYMMQLYSQLAWEVNMAKRQGLKDRQEDMTRKKDAMYQLGRAVKYKQEACSRMLTAAIGYDRDLFERPDGKGREEQADAIKAKRSMKGWSNV